MAPKQDRVYARGRSKSIAPSACLVIGSDNERDPDNVPPTTCPQALLPHPELHVLLEPYPKRWRASCCLGVSWLEEVSGSTEVPTPATTTQSASSDEVDSFESTPGSPTHSLTPVVDQPKWWCVDGQYQVYLDSMFLNDKRVMTRTLTFESRVLTISLTTMPVIHSLFTRHRLLWTARSFGCYSEELVRYFYASYVATLISQIDRRASLAKQAPLEHVRVCGIQIDACHPPVDGPDLSFDGEGADWVTEPKGAIKNTNMNFMVKFLWLIVRHCLSPTTADNIVTWDRAVLMEAMIAGFEMDFSLLVQAVMHERDFKVTTTYPFSCMIFSLCRSVGVPIWHIDLLKTPLGTIYIALIRDDANELAPRRGPRQEFPPLCDNLANTVAQGRTATQDPFETTDTNPIKSIPGSSCTLSSSRSTLFPPLVPLSRVHKLDAQMSTLLHHIQPWMQWSIAESEKCLERRMVQHRERKIAEVHQHFDALELRVLARPSPQVDVTTLQAAFKGLRAHIDMILEARVPESEAPSTEPIDDTVMAALFATSEIPPPPPREHAKRRRGREEDESRARKKERREIEAARRVSLADEEARKMRVVESASGASRSRNLEIAGGTTDSGVAAKESTEGVQIKELVGFREPDPPTC
ncbi:hypothetical protein EJD97_007517 [Solanum chilense]|uniref:Putative plant transposon protein domain-containing protein n=1 Tax=Solanum chilense TaxID=4083 RepID=A0A6N2CIH9_SOLCI|nr:hypothetical protein EJD97_007517 [Solanum chilense]